MTSSISIRPARPDDAPLAAAVFRLSMEGLADFLFGSDGRQTEIDLMRLFSSNTGRFGYSNAHVAELNRQPRGMLISFPGAEANRLSLASGLPMFKLLGTRFFGFAARSLSFANIRESKADEYLVSNLAVLPAAQGQGLGTRLLEHAEILACALDIPKCALLVTTDNETALRLYRKHGYKVISTHHHQKPPVSFHRMVKVIGK